MRGGIDSITIKSDDGDWIIESVDEYIYWIRYSRRRGGYKIKTTDNDYFIKDCCVNAIIVKYQEDY